MELGQGFASCKVLGAGGVVDYGGVYRCLPTGLLDAYIAMIPQFDVDSTPLGQRPLYVLLFIYRLWVSLTLTHLKGWVEG